MERRWLLFLYLVFMAFLINYTLPNLIWGPPQQVAQNDKKDAKPEGADKAKPKDADGKVKDGEKQPGDDEKQPADAPEGGKPSENEGDEKPNDEPPADEKESEQTVPQEWLTLGSLDPTSANPFRLLVTFTNRGAAIRRLELADPQFRDIEDHTGYLGHLETVRTRENNGLRVQIVGPGTPAAIAGMQPDDVIESINDREVNTPTALWSTLREFRPRDSITVNIRRGTQKLALSVELRRVPLSLLRPELDHLRDRGVEPPVGFVDPPSLEMTLAQLGKSKLADDAVAEIAGAELRDVTWEVADKSETQITFRRQLRAGLEVIKRYVLEKIPDESRTDRTYPAYHVILEVELRNTGEGAREVAYQLDGPTGLPTEGWWYSTKIGRVNGVGVRDVVGQWLGQDPLIFPTTQIANGEDSSLTHDHSVMYLGADAQYFSAVLLPLKEKVEDVWFARTQAIRIGPAPLPNDNLMLQNVSCRMVSHTQELAAGQSLKHRFKFFAGPKQPALLVKYHQPSDEAYNLDSLVYFGWPIWAVVARAMLAILHFFYGIVHNYGIAIILLTVLVRACMFPLSRKQAISMIKTQELQPEIKRIQEKYKKDMEKRTKAMQDLFRKHNHNPMGGCLLMFLQLPIFLGLYRALMIDIELRGAPLFSENIRWCSNLGAPDMMFNWSGFMPQFVVHHLGPYFNLLPLITVGLFLVQQKMFMPPPADEQAAMQQKIMKYMMVVIGVLFYKVASGLCIYFIASTLWGMAERKYLPKFQGHKPENPDEPNAVFAEAAPGKSGPTNGSNGNGARSKKQKRK